MVVGIGIDLVHVPRIARIAKRWNARFMDRVFTPHEQQTCLKRHDPHPAFAARFAAKEAFFKASTLDHLSWKEIEVLRGKSGNPTLRLSGHAAETHGTDRLFVSLSHEGDYATAQVVIERQ